MLLEELKPLKTRNFVAKNSRNKSGAGIHKDKKNDYQRRPKHKKRLDDH